MKNFCGILFVLIVLQCAVAVIIDYYPKPAPGSTAAGSNLIWYEQNKNTDVIQWVAQTESYINKYRYGQETAYKCGYDEDKRPPGKMCDINIDWPECSLENNFGYHKSSPCVFIVLNEAYGWTPKLYNSTEDLPPEMPKSLMKYISNIKATNPKAMNSVWISCNGNNEIDVELAGPIDYLPFAGIPSYFFPYRQEDTKLLPIIAVKFYRPVRGIAINIVCNVWTKDILAEQSKHTRSVNFDLLID